MDTDLDRRTLELLVQHGDRSVAELERALARSPSAIRRRLARLARDGQVKSTREGRHWRWHAIAPAIADPSRVADPATTCGAWIAARELQVTPTQLAELVRTGVLCTLMTRDGERYDRAAVARVRARMMRAKTQRLPRPAGR